MSLEPLLAAPVAIQIHAFAAIAAALLGAVVLFRRKGTPIHKLMGRIWVALMVVVATSALFITEIRMIGPFSPIHILIPVVYGSVILGIWYIRHGNVLAHRATMQSLYFGSLGLAGAFTFTPGRRMHQVLFGPDAGWTPSLIMIAVVLTLTAVFWYRLAPRRKRRAV